MIMGKLKAATGKHHDEMEKIVNVMEHTFAMEDYKELLKKFYRFYSSIEPLIAASGLKGAGFEKGTRAKAHLLEADLASLGLDREIDALRGSWRGTPVIDSPEKALGCAYVMEGATLGGQVIMRELKQRLDIDRENGGRFFNSYGVQVGPMWKEFCAFATEFAANGENDDEIVAAAQATFDSFASCFGTETAAHA